MEYQSERQSEFRFRKKEKKTPEFLDTRPVRSDVSDLALIEESFPSSTSPDKQRTELEMPSKLSECEDDEKQNCEPTPSDFVFFASNSTFHGISHFVNGSNFTLRKALWAVAFFTSLGLFLHQGHNRYRYYQSFPHVTKLDEQEAQIMFFPAITICNLNSFRLNALKADDYFYAGQAIFRLLDSNFEIIESRYKDNVTWQKVKKTVDPVSKQKRDYKARKDWTMFDLYNRTGHTLKGMLKVCRYRGETCNSTRWKTVFTRYGKCYTFNMGPNPLTTLKGGVDNGLELLLDTQQDDYMPVWDETDEISIEAGFKIQIHKQTEPPFIHELGFGISPGFQTLVATQEQRITFLPKPWGNCRNKMESRHSDFKDYSISACRIICETEIIIQKCDCRMIHMPDFKGVRFCSAEDYMKCADRELDDLVKKNDKQCVCETPCNVTRYNLEMSSLQLPSTQALSYLASKYGKSEDYVSTLAPVFQAPPAEQPFFFQRNNFAKLNVFFEALNYETIEQKRAYEIPGLLGDIGGQMGLFIGASILTILELVDYLYEVLKAHTWGKKQRKRKSDVEKGKADENEETRPESVKSYVATNFSAANQDGYVSRTAYNTFSNGQTKHDAFHLPSASSMVRYDTKDESVTVDAATARCPPPPQYIGNSLSFNQERPGDTKWRVHPNFTSNSSTLNGAGYRRPPRETSASYSELYRPVESHWRMADEIRSQYNFPVSSFGDYADTRLQVPVGSSQIFTTLPSNADSTSHNRPESCLFSPVSVMSNGNNPGQSVHSLSKPAPARPGAQNYNVPIETDIV